MMSLCDRTILGFSTPTHPPLHTGHTVSSSGEKPALWQQWLLPQGGLVIPCEGNSSLGLGKTCVPCVLATPRGDKLQEAGLQLLRAQKAARKERTMDRREESLEKEEGDSCRSGSSESRMLRRTKPTRKKNKTSRDHGSFPGKALTSNTLFQIQNKCTGNEIHHLPERGLKGTQRVWSEIWNLRGDL